MKAHHAMAEAPHTMLKLPHITFKAPHIMFKQPHIMFKAPHIIKAQHIMFKAPDLYKAPHNAQTTAYNVKSRTDNIQSSFSFIFFLTFLTYLIFLFLTFTQFLFIQNQFFLPKIQNRTARQRQQQSRITVHVNTCDITN